MQIRLAAGIALAGMLAIPSAWAEECRAGWVLEKYQAAVAAESAGQLGTAETAYAALAAEGFAPAQRRLAEALDRRGGAPTEAYRWAALAAKHADRQAGRLARQVEPRVDMGARIDIDRQLSDWRPLLGPCSRALVERGQAGQSISPREFVENVITPKNTPDPQALSRQVAFLLLRIAKTEPSLLPYLTALRSIKVAALDQSVAARVDEPPAGGATLTIAQHMLTDNDGAKVPAVIAALRQTVHLLADPPPTIRENYHGYDILVRSYDQNDAALALVRKAVDMIPALPPDLRSLVAQPRQLVISPTQPGEQKRAIATLMVNEGEKDGYVRFSNLPASHSAVDVLAGLAATGEHLSRLRAGRPDDPEAVASAGERVRKILRNKS